MTITEPAKELEVVKEYDTAVCGGGIAGISAALASARNGAKTIIIEREYMLGGLATAGLIAIYLPICDGCGKQVSFGIAEELLRFSLKRGTDSDAHFPTEWLDGNNSEDRLKHRFQAYYNPQIFACDIENLLAQNGVDILYGTHICSVKTDGERITHLIAENKSGRTAIGVKTVVDATGDADIALFSGENTALFKQGNILAAWYYATKNGKYTMCMLGACDVPDDEKTLAHPTPLINRRFGGVDADEITEQVLLSHKTALADFLSKGQFGKDYSLSTLPTIPQIRMTRRIDGQSIMSDRDMHKEFPDSVGLFSDWRKSGPVYELRFSSLIGNKVKNLICAGRNISVTDSMWDITRVIPVCAVSGQAAGTAAALFEDFSKADIKLIQKKLSADGVKLHEKEL